MITLVALIITLCVLIIVMLVVMTVLCLKLFKKLKTASLNPNAMRAKGKGLEPIPPSSHRTIPQQKMIEDDVNELVEPTEKVKRPATESAN